MYFTNETEMAIIAYNKETSDVLKNKVFNEFIYYPFQKLSENIIHTFKFYYFDGGTREVQQEVIAFLIEKMGKFVEGKGKAFSYFGQIAKNYLIQNNNKNYKDLKNKAPISVIDFQRDLGAEQALQEKRDGLDVFMEGFIVYYGKMVDEKFKSQRDKKIAHAVLKLFEDRKNIEIFNKKALYIMIREMTNTKTQHITKVVNVIKEDFALMYKKFENGAYF
tara:strand:- start:168 stop:827 length:660 start_codon:yes stop_codon:yes gene_type:complete